MEEKLTACCVFFWTTDSPGDSLHNDVLGSRRATTDDIAALPSLRVFSLVYLFVIVVLFINAVLSIISLH